MMCVHSDLNTQITSLLSHAARNSKQQIRNHPDREQTSPAIVANPHVLTCPLTRQQYSHSDTPPHSRYSCGRKMEEFSAPLLLSNGTTLCLNLSSRAAASSAGVALSGFVGDCCRIISQPALIVHMHMIIGKR